MQTFVQPMGTLCDACPGHGQDHGTKGLRFVVNGCQQLLRLSLAGLMCSVSKRVKRLKPQEYFVPLCRR